MRINLKNGKKLDIVVKRNNELYEYYIGNQKIGVYDPNKMYEKIIIKENTLENELSSQIKDQINQLDKSEIVLEAEENKNLDEYAQELGIERENTRQIRKIDLQEDIEKGKDKKGEEQKNKSKTYVGKEGQDQQVATTRNVNIEQEIDLWERANDMHDIRKWLGGKIPPEMQKIGIIESDDMDEMTNEKGEKYKNGTTRYSLVVIGKDGKVEPLQKYIPQLQQRSASGNNPTQEKYQVRKDGSVEKDAVLSEYEIGNKIIQIDNKEMGRVELNIGQEEHGGTETMGEQVRDSNSTYATPIENRKVMGEFEENGEYTINENLKEAEEHRKRDPDCDKMRTEEIDGDPKTSSHTDNITSNYIEYSNGEKVTFSELAQKWGFIKDGRPDANYVRKMVNDLRQKETNKKPEEIVEDLDEEFEEDPRVSDGRNIS